MGSQSTWPGGSTNTHWLAGVGEEGREKIIMASYQMKTKHFFSENKSTSGGACTYNNFWKVFVNLLHEVQKVMNLGREQYGKHVNPRLQENVPPLFHKEREETKLL